MYVLADEDSDLYIFDVKCQTYPMKKDEMTDRDTTPLSSAQLRPSTSFEMTASG